MTQEQMADRLDVTFQQVQKYEKGANRVAASRLYEISMMLDVPVSFFFEGFGDNQSDVVGDTPDDNKGDSQVMTFIMSMEGFALNRAFAAIKSPSTRAELLALIRGLASEAPDRASRGAQ